MHRRWTLEPPANPSVLRIHLDHELTDRTIVTAPPAAIAGPLGGLLELEAVRTVDLHRYHARVNLVHGADRPLTTRHVREILQPAWGDEMEAVAASDPRAFEVDYAGPRVVAESAEMAVGRDLLERLFTVDGVHEAILGEGLILVSIGRLFAWSTVEPAVVGVLRSA